MLLHTRSLSCIAFSLLVAASTADADGEFLLQKPFSEVLTKSDAVVVARRLSPTIVGDSAPNRWSNGQFQVVELLKGDSALGETQIDARVRIAVTTNDLFLLKAVRNDADASLRWRVSQPISVSCREHLLSLSKLKTTGAQRLAFYENVLKHPDTEVSANAHLEFWLASNETFSAVSAQMDREKILAWIKTPEAPLYRQRLYLAMLARCGTEADSDWLEEKIVAGRGQPLLDAWIGCYLALKGAAGLPLINRLCLSDTKAYQDDPKAGIADTYRAMLALRFVRDLPNPSIPEELIAQSFRLVLEDEIMADLAVPELVYHEDWASLDRVSTSL